MIYQYDDGGRLAAGFKARADDCVCRSIAIAGKLDYQAVYNRLALGNFSQRRSKHDEGKRVRSARNGISTRRKWFPDYMKAMGFFWTATCKPGSTERVHLIPDELPSGRLVVAVSKHYTAVIDGVLHDTHDCSRDGTRMVYGYWLAS
tara:strand:- start:167 stop:607 length:441 start_codon:yes stop_codon:yes gene_type:complete